jgi:FkbM family methyltransferase
MARTVHTFENGVRVFEDQLLEEQRARYRKRNVHEADEEDIFVQLIQRLPADGCFVDVGAAIGYYLILARRLAPGLTIHGVEPLKRHRSFLAENRVLNGLAESDFTIHSEGLTSAEGEEAFFDRGYSSRLGERNGEEKMHLSTRWKHLLQRLGLRKTRDISFSISTITLDTLVRRIGRPIDLLQMDVQGLETEVLKGGAASLETGAIKTFLIGTHGRARGLTIHDDCRRILRAHDYLIEIDNPSPAEQPDGILVASK